MVRHVILLVWITGLWAGCCSSTTAPRANVPGRTKRNANRALRRYIQQRLRAPKTRETIPKEHQVSTDVNHRFSEPNHANQHNGKRHKRHGHRQLVSLDSIVAKGSGGQAKRPQSRELRRRLHKSKKSHKGKGKGKGKGGSDDDGYDICRELNFGEFYGQTGGKGGHSGRRNGKGHRQLTSSATPRQLQFDGAYCEPNIFQSIAMDPDYSIFVDLMTCAGLDVLFDCAGPFTLLIPSNAAFEENPGLLRSFYNPYNLQAVQEMLLYHIVPGLFLAEDVTVGPMQTLLGDSVDVATIDPLVVNQASVIMADILGCNGIAHALDDVLIPPDSPILPEICEIVDFRQAGQFPLASRLRQLRQSLDDATIVVRSPANHPYQVVKAVDGMNQRHRSLQFQGERCDFNVFEAARENPDLSYFVELVEAAGLVDFFFCAGPFTVLAPVNSAFADLDPALLEDLLRPQNQQLLQELILYHLLPEFQPSTSFTAGPAETLLFDSFVQVGVGPVTFDGASVVEADTEACNGVLHTIDTVLSPDGEDVDDICEAFDFSSQGGGENCVTNVLDTARTYPELSVVVSLLTAADLDGIFDCAGPFTALLPTNTALDNLTPEFVEFLLAPENQDDLRDLLLYHIIPEATMTSAFVDGPTETLLQGESVEVTTTPIQFDGINVVSPNIEACNGYIHTINAVLNPFDSIDPPVAPPVATPVTDRPTRSPVADETVEPTALSQTETPVVGPTTLPATEAPVAEATDPPDTDAPDTNPPDTDAPDTDPPDTPETEPPTDPPDTAATPPPATDPPDTADTPPPATEPPSDATTVRIEDYFIAFVTDGAREPTPEEYARILDTTIAYFDGIFRAKYPDTFVGLDSTSDFTRFMAGIPEAKYNVYVNFDVAEVQFAPGSTPPSTEEIFTTMADSASGAAGVDYILNAAQPLTGTPFETTTEVIFGATELPGP